MSELPRTSELPPTQVHCVQHCQQRFDWDCGVSCLLMMLPESQRRQISDNLEDFCVSQGFGHSTWTIDLCYLMKELNLNFQYTTITLGVNRGFDEKMEFYNRILDRDENRVNERFSEAHSFGIRVEERSVSLTELLTHLARLGPAIILTNANLLCCDHCNLSKCCGVAILLRHCSRSRIYQGHYILAVGYDLPNRKIVYRNPTLRDRECIMSFDCFEEARTSFGTDEDIVFVDRLSRAVAVKTPACPKSIF